MDPVVYAAVKADDVPEEDTELRASLTVLGLADLTLASLETSFITLSENLAASATASICLYRPSDAASIFCSRSVPRNCFSSLAVAAAAVFSSPIKAPANLNQFEMRIQDLNFLQFFQTSLK